MAQEPTHSGRSGRVLGWVVGGEQSAGKSILPPRGVPVRVDPEWSWCCHPGGQPPTSPPSRECDGVWPNDDDGRAEATCVFPWVDVLRHSTTRSILAVIHAAPGPEVNAGTPRRRAANAAATESPLLGGGGAATAQVGRARPAPSSSRASRIRPATAGQTCRLAVSPHKCSSVALSTQHTASARLQPARTQPLAGGCWISLQLAHRPLGGGEHHAIVWLFQRLALPPARAVRGVCGCNRCARRGGTEAATRRSADIGSGRRCDEAIVPSIVPSRRPRHQSPPAPIAIFRR